MRAGATAEENLSSCREEEAAYPEAVLDLCRISRTKL